MKRLKITLIFCLLGALPCFAGSGYTLSGGVLSGEGVTAGGSYSDILFHWDAENSLVADKGGITGTNSGSVFDNTIFQTGSYSISRNSNNDYLDFTITTSHFEKAGGQVAFWWYNGNGYQAASGNYILTIGDTVNDYLRFQMHSSGGVGMRWIANGGAAQVAEYTASSLATSTWFYVVGKWHPGDAGNDLTLTIYNTDGTTAGSATAATATAMTDNPIQIRFGSAPGDAYRDNMDHLVITNDTARDMWAIRAVADFN